MNNQERENQPKEEIDVSKRRRFLQKAGAVTPVILTFTSPTAFGGTVLCISQQMSGNVSRTVTPNCEPGALSPESLAPAKTPALGSDKIALGQSSSFPTIGDYSQDTVFNSVFLHSSNKNTFGKIVATSTDSREAVYIAAFLNAQQSQSYVLTPAQVIELFDNPSNRPSGYSSDTQFLLSTFK